MRRPRRAKFRLPDGASMLLLWMRYECRLFLWQERLAVMGRRREEESRAGAIRSFPAKMQSAIIYYFDLDFGRRYALEKASFAAIS